MKKTMRILLLSLVLVLLLLALAACGHEHSFDEAWSHDGSHHWHAPTCEHEKAEDMPDVRDFGTHDMKAEPIEVVAATCGRAGTATYECKVCGFRKVVSTPATGAHTYGSELVYTEDKANGVIYSQQQCTVCGKKGPHLHIFDEKWSTDETNHWHAPSCKCEGADAPGNIYVGAHEFGDAVTVAPTCTKAGATTKTCKTCSYTVTLATTPALGHTETVTSYISDGVSVTAKKTCSTCRTTRNERVEGARIVNSTASAQAALDAAAEGAFLYFQKADYGTLTFKAIGLGESYTAADGTIHYRAFKNITLVAQEGATFAGFVTEGSTSAAAVALSFENVTLQGFRFTGSGSALHFDGCYKINGLTLDGCSMEPAAALEAGDKPYLLLTATDAATLSSQDGNWSFTTSRKNITVRDCTVEGICGLVSLLGTENVTITGNSLKSITDEALLLASGSTAYTGKVTVSGNTVFGLGDRFLLATNFASVKLTLTENSVGSYSQDADADIVKVTGTVTEPVMTGNTFPKDKVVSIPGMGQ